MTTITLEIDGRQVEVPGGSTVMDAAHKLGIYIPHFCYHKKLSIAANCRMCLVQVEKAPKPLPACATPATEGMKAWTHSELAIDAQKGVMEFLLINHPLDCPICDQGGECQLQDLAVGYGASNSRYQEMKRVVTNKNLGPLISTDMTRCIHCTRCVRFGEEIAGIMELGMAGRGEHSEIMAFVGRTVDSEISGNVIDLCPVGALTSKPFRYTARPWELARRKSVSPHDSLGANLIVCVRQAKVMRVLPLETEAINECWLSDRDRFSYEGLNSEDRLKEPLLKQNGKWQAASWQAALEFVAARLREIAKRDGADAIGALAAPNQTLEELYLLQKLVRRLGSGNVDHRLRQSDFGLDGSLQGAPWLGTSVAEISSLKRLLIVGSSLRLEQPLLAARIRRAVKRGCELALINPVDDDLLIPIAHKAIVAPHSMAQMLAQITQAAAELSGGKPAGASDRQLAPVKVSDAARAIAQGLRAAQPAAIVLGNLALHHPSYAALHVLAQLAARTTGASFGVFGEPNGVGAYLAGAVPHRGVRGESAIKGLNASQMLENPRTAYLLMGVEAELDTYNPRQCLQALKSAELVVAMTPYRNALDYADVILPIAPFTETAGTFVNCEGRVQSFNGAVKPLGETRPAWKVLRVLANELGLAGFEYSSAEEVRNEALRGSDLAKLLSNEVQDVSIPDRAWAKPGGLERVGEVPLYGSDSIVRRAPSLQKTRAAAPPVAALSGALL
ncbi:MAG TPA: NADH-quinone oxidoreductase subunit NuoG, partial [Burkholderiales bacterium]|nr:NADH-quinone oxidoreductase subunit NuoG [Burkholderiales bacterium]